MSAHRSGPLLAVDVGNTNIGVGLFADVREEPLPRPEATTRVSLEATAFDGLKRWLGDHLSDPSQARWLIASVNDAVEATLQQWLSQPPAPAPCRRIAAADIPMPIEVEHAEKVGIDRLLAAAAADALRDPARPAIVIDAGTAITVDAISPQGAFLGGAILPGMAMAAHILDRYTEKLPRVETDQLRMPPPIGRNTVAALESGIYWGTVGALTRLVEEISAQWKQPPQLFLTGGDAPRLGSHFPAANLAAHLVLSGMALTARRLQSQSQSST